MEKSFAAATKFVQDLKSAAVIGAEACFSHAGFSHESWGRQGMLWAIRLSRTEPEPVHYCTAAVTIEEAFSRMLGLIRKEEESRLRGKEDQRKAETP